MNVVCTDNRFEVIAAYKKMLTERTNIETSTDEMAVIDNVLFRFWQLGWLPPIPHGSLIEKHDVFKLITAFPEVDKLLPVEFMEALYNLPTIIPADVPDNNVGNIPAEEGET